MLKKSDLFAFNAWAKGLILRCRPHRFLGFTEKLNLFFSNTVGLSRWIASQEKSSFNDFYTPGRDGKKREQLYKHVISDQHLDSRPIDYLEFGVCGGSSFFWWLQANNHPDSRFYGFDTFEGLPEDWGFGFRKGDMASGMPELSDPRAKFLKGLFQTSLPPFLKGYGNPDRKKIIHLDADLFSSTLFALTSLSPFLRPGDILFFDEFNVPNHEYFAFKTFTEAFYIQTRLLGAVNNYYQVALRIEHNPAVPL